MIRTVTVPEKVYERMQLWRYAEMPQDIPDNPQMHFTSPLHWGEDTYILKCGERYQYKVPYDVFKYAYDGIYVVPASEQSVAKWYREKHPKDIDKYNLEFYEDVSFNDLLDCLVQGEEPPLVCLGLEECTNPEKVSEKIIGELLMRTGLDHNTTECLWNSYKKDPYTMKLSDVLKYSEVILIKDRPDNVMKKSFNEENHPSFYEMAKRYTWFSQSHPAISVTCAEFMEHNQKLLNILDAFDNSRPPQEKHSPNLFSGDPRARHEESPHYRFTQCKHCFIRNSDNPDDPSGKLYDISDIDRWAEVHIPGGFPDEKAAQDYVDGVFSSNAMNLSLYYQVRQRKELLAEYQHLPRAIAAKKYGMAACIYIKDCHNRHMPLTVVDKRAVKTMMDCGFSKKEIIQTINQYSPNGVLSEEYGNRVWALANNLQIKEKVHPKRKEPRFTR